MKKLLALLPLFLTGCVSVPDGITPVADFQADRYLGKWYEIARLDHSFERGLTQVSAEYTMQADGGISVLNRGYSEKDKKWKQAEGQASFAGKKDKGFLKVTFFWPFYGSYIVFDLDQENYRHALVCGPNRSYLWILAREKTLDPKIQDRLLAKAAASGFETNKLIFAKP